MEQKTLLRLVKTWEISDKPEYRGFRCANCQRYINRAWHYWLKQGGYRTPVHFCNICESKFKSSKIKVIYKPFTCDKCGKKMCKAWHVWTKKDDVLSEAHFCEKCGEKVGFSKEIKGIIYDLDGTIISTIKLHESAWLYAGKKFNIPISKEMLITQRGISNEAAAKIIVPGDKKYLMKKFITAKAKYVMENVNQIIIFPGAMDTIQKLSENGCKVWICTTGHRNYVKKILNNSRELKKIGKNIVWREMYKKEKPSPEALNLVERKMGLTNAQVCYIGDAFGDYQMSKAARVKFIYFCPNIKNKDLKIPQSIPIITSHSEFLRSKMKLKMKL